MCHHDCRDLDAPWLGVPRLAAATITADRDYGVTCQPARRGWYQRSSGGQHPLDPLSNPDQHHPSLPRNATLRVATAQTTPLHAAVPCNATLRVATAQTSPLRVATAQTTPLRVATAQTSPLRMATAQTSPLRVAATQTSPLRMATAQTSPLRVAATQTSPLRNPTICSAQIVAQAERAHSFHLPRGLWDDGRM